MKTSYFYRANNSSERGVTIVEAALTIPIFLFLIFASLEMGWVIYNKIALQFALNKTARWAITSQRDPIEIMQRLQIESAPYGLAVAPEARVATQNSSDSLSVAANSESDSKLFIAVCGSDDLQSCQSENGITQSMLPGPSEEFIMRARLRLALMISRIEVDIDASVVAKNEPYLR